MTATSSEREPLSPGGPKKTLGWLRGSTPTKRRVPTIVWAFLAILVTLGLATWGFHDLSVTPTKLDWPQSFYRAVRIYTLDLGPAGGGNHSGPNLQLWIALLLAAALVTQGAIALWRNRLRRTATRHLLRDHVIVCGGGVHGTVLVAALCGGRPAREDDQMQNGEAGPKSPDGEHDVVLVDIDPRAPGMSAPPGKYEWRLVGDAALEQTLISAGAAHASWVVAVTGDDYINSQIASTVHELVSDGKARDRVHVLVQVEDPSLTRFLEEDTELVRRQAESRGRTALPVVSPFSANAIAAEALLDGALRHDGSPLLEMHDGRPPSILLAGDHPLIDALLLAALRRWHEQILNSTRPPLRISVFGPDAVARVERLELRWRPLPAVATIEATDAQIWDEAAYEWLREDDRADHAFVVCVEELEGVKLTLGVSRALGAAVAMTRVTAQPGSVLDDHVEIHTERNTHLAPTKVVELAEIASDPSALQAPGARQRLKDALAPRAEDAPLFDRPELEIHSDSYWRISERERPLLESLVAPVPLSALVRARLVVDLSVPGSLRTVAEKLSKTDPAGAGFTAWCCYAWSLNGEQLDAGFLPVVSELAEMMLWLRARAQRPGDGDPHGPLAGARDKRIAILAGGAGGMSDMTATATSRLLRKALIGYDGLILSGGTAAGLPGIAGEIAGKLGIRTVGYAPQGEGDPRLYPELRHTADCSTFGVRQPLQMWGDIIDAGIPISSVRLLAFPGGDITRQEILLGRALGARVAWIDPASEVAEALEDQLPLGADGVLELPADPMTARAFLMPSQLPPEEESLRIAIAQSNHSAYRRNHRKRKSPTDPAMAPWETEVASMKRSSLAQVDDIPNKLALMGKQIAPVGEGEPLLLAEDQLELLAEVEHGRWNLERLCTGWKLGPVRDIARKTTPHLVPWVDLDEKTRDYDREAVRNIAPALKAAKRGVQRRPG